MRQFITSHGKINAIDAMLDNSDNWVILFHGFGADAYDLQALSEALVPPSPTNWLFPQGILEVPIGPGWTGRAWWEIDVETLQKRQLQGNALDLSGEKPVRLAKLRPQIMAMIEQLFAPQPVDWTKIILGGFSQGAMLATDIFLHAPQTPRGLLLFSGALINKDEWKSLVSTKSGARYFICHGQQDLILPHRSAQQLESLLNSGGMKGGLFSFQGGHEIPPQVILKANEYLKGLAT